MRHRVFTFRIFVQCTGGAETLGGGRIVNHRQTNKAARVLYEKNFANFVAG